MSRGSQALKGLIKDLLKRRKIRPQLTLEWLRKDTTVRVCVRGPALDDPALQRGRLRAYSSRIAIW
jgi:hypothetical protein